MIGSCLSSRPRDFELLDEHVVGLVHLEARDERRALAEAAVAHHRVVHRQAVFLADDEVFLAMRGRGVHGAGARLERHVIADDHRHVFRQERMLELQVLERVARELRQHLALAESVTRQAGVEQFVREHQQLGLAVARHPEHARIRSSRPSATASLAGSVQGVVVQMTSDAGLRRRVRRSSMPTRRAKSAGSTTRNSTSTAGEVLSSYSTSASASDERQSRHQYTGFAPL